MVKYFLTKNFSNRKKDNQYSFYMLNIQQYNQPQLHLTTIPIDYLYRQQWKRLSANEQANNINRMKERTKKRADIFKMKRRKGFRKKHGHRTQYTQIKVTAIAQ